ncbi:hypothetical protein [Haloarchaeobius baliensis]|uniref:hypothetical protein n=1 Tax=Haloarchaeobius baliensis TaxID=1670458 RepID=UPI003F880C82
MSAEKRTPPRVVLVSVAALCCVAPLSFAALMGGAGTIASWFGVTPVAGPVETAIAVLASVLALVLTSVAVDVAFDGATGVRTGGPWSVVRLASVWSVVAATAVVMLDVAVALLLAVPGHGYSPFVAAIPLVFLTAFAVATVRTVVAFRDGLATAR